MGDSSPTLAYQNCVSHGLGGGFGIGEILAQRKCTKFCRGALKTKAICLAVGFSALRMHCPLVPTQSALQGPFGRSVGGYCGLPLAFVNDAWSIISKRIQHHIEMPSGTNSNHPEASSKQKQATNICGVCLFSCHNGGILCQILQWYLRIRAKYSPHHILPFQILHVPNPPNPPHPCRQFSTENCNQCVHPEAPVGRLAQS